MMKEYNLGDIAPIKQGKCPQNDYIWLLNLEMVESNTGNIIDYEYVKPDKIGDSTVSFDTTNVLYSKLRPYLNKVVLPNQPGYATSEMVVLKPNPEIITREYLTYFLRSDYFVKYINSKTTGAKMPRVNMKDLKQVKIPCPSLDRQNYIVNLFQRCIRIINIRRKELNLLDELVKARFVELFGDPGINDKRWPERKMLDIGHFKNGMNFHNDESGILINCLGVGDFKGNSVIKEVSSLPLISLSKMPANDYLLKDNDIVFVRSNGNKSLVGRSVAVYPGDIPTTFSGFCIRYRINNNDIMVSYLLGLLKADSIRRKIIGQGANIQNLNQKILGTLVIPVPPLSVQEKFANLVIQVEKSKSVIQKSLDETQILFQSLMQEYFG